MSFGNTERSWLDEFWSLWQCDSLCEAPKNGSTDLEDSKPPHCWAYEKKKKPTYLILETNYCHFKPYVYDPKHSTLDEN